MQIQTIPNTINYRNNYSTKYTAFTGVSAKVAEQAAEMPKSKIFEPAKKFFAPITKPWKKVMDGVKEGIALGSAKILKTDVAHNAISKLKGSKNIVDHLSAFTGVVLSGFYIKKTLKNDNLDTKKRKTLAINQASTCVISTIGAYTISKYAGKQVNKFTDKFMAANIKSDIQDLAKYKRGIKAASSMMIFGMMYRFISPVLVTPIANHIGNKMEENKQAKLAETKQLNK